MLDRPQATTLLLGVGNRILSDEGVGIHVIERLMARYEFPEEVLVLDGGTLGLDLLYYLEGVENLLLVDAVQNGGEPGNLSRLEGDDVPAFMSIKMSPHHIGIPDMLFAAKLKDIYPKNVVLLGVQPERLEVGLELSPAVEAQVETLIEQVIEQLKEWGHHPRRKTS
ncbi:MAG: HyaD/HybD family hydrogenase maturation endopeptidase [Anaerolineae bacterium]|nr:MAG: HyaD/HybD family hydrogenase maturation endopeptidase [Anaerolineae bacterium]